MCSVPEVTELENENSRDYPVLCCPSRMFRNMAFPKIWELFVVIEGDRSKFYFLQEDPEYKITRCKFAVSLPLLTERPGPGFLNHPW